MTASWEHSSTLDQNVHVAGEVVPIWLLKRLYIAVLGCFGFIQYYASVVNINIAIVCMVNKSLIEYGSVAENNLTNIECQEKNTDVTTSGRGSFEWDTKIQGYVLGAFYWGYLAFQIPAAWLATRFGARRVLGVSQLMASVATLLMPLAANSSYIYLIVLRIFLGLLSGAMYPSMYYIMSHWIPPLERSKLIAITYSGTDTFLWAVIWLLTVSDKPATHKHIKPDEQKYIIASLAEGAHHTSRKVCKMAHLIRTTIVVCQIEGPTLLSDLEGTATFLWAVIWLLTVSDKPATHKHIKPDEQKYIIASLAEGAHHTSRKIAKSMPNYAIIVDNVCFDWAVYTFMTYIPTYSNDVLKLNIEYNGILPAVPYIAFWIVVILSGWLADLCQQRKLMSRTITRKVFTAIGSVVPASFCIALGYVDCSSTGLAILLLTLTVSMVGFQYSGYVVNHVDIAPYYAAILFGISNAFASVGGFVVPIIVGEITHEAQTRAEWQIVFYMTAAVLLFEAMFYTVFGSGYLQPWAKPTIAHTRAELQIVFYVTTTVLLFEAMLYTVFGSGNLQPRAKPTVVIIINNNVEQTRLETNYGFDRV